MHKPQGRFLLTPPSVFFKSLLFLTLFVAPAAVSAQQSDAGGELTFNIILGILVLSILVVVFAMLVVGDRLVKMAASTLGGDDAKSASVIPSKEELFPKSIKYPEAGTNDVIKLKKGFDINVAGRPVRQVEELMSNTYAVKPKDFIGMIPIPKMLVEEGEEVKAGDALFFDKYHPEVMYTAPVSGEIAEIRRAEKRSIAEVVILADKTVNFKQFDVPTVESASREGIVKVMLESGTWPMVRQRPYNVVADPEDNPKAIFISSFDTSPLAPNYNFTLAGDGAAFQAGLDVLNKLTDGKVHLGLNALLKPADIFTNAENVEKNWFAGPHPSGNVGVQIHHVDPIAKNEVVWHVGPQDVVIIGRLFLEGKYDTSKLVALAGPEVAEPKYYKTYMGAGIETLVKDHLKNDHVRYISGNVLTGKKVQTNSHLSFFDNLVSVIEEGDKYEMFGWILPSYARPSLSPTFPWGFFPGIEFEVNTNTHGEERALVVTGQYEKVLPMDIYPVHLIKAILARDFDQMEGLGIYEVDEEDLALCEFVCTSKTEVQDILREGLDYMREQS